MGNSASSSRAHQDDTVDYGFLTPQGVYTGTPDWNQQTVAQLIIDRRLAPFYRPLDDYDENWDDEQILAARKQLPGEDVATSDSASRVDSIGSIQNNVARSNSVHSSVHSSRRPGALKEPSRLPEAMVYRGAIECPICFLYYPPNINHSRCCDQAICTECFVQIKRSEPTTTHVVSEPAACPYCVQENFGVTYKPPPWRAGIGADGSSPITVSSSRASSQQSELTSKSRRKSFGADSAEVVTIDQIRPDWEAKLAAVRAAVARRANRRIIMRQVGDRLIPVGVTSGRIHPLNGEASVPANAEQGGENSNENEGRLGRRSRRRHQQQPQDLNQLLGTMGLGGQDLEELMIMEAMRLSLLEHEEQQRKEGQAKKKEEAERIARGELPSDSGSGGNQPGPSSAPGVELPTIPTTSPIDVHQSSRRGLYPDNSFSPSLRSISNSPRSSPASNSLVESGASFRQPASSPLSSLAVSSLSVTSAHSGSHSHSRSGSDTPSIRAPTPSAFSNAALATHGPVPGVLAANDDRSADSEAASVPVSSTSSTIAVTQISNPLTATTAAEGEEHQEADVSITNALVSVPEAGNNQSLASLFTTNIESRPYSALPSSPDSPSRRPLLLETPASEEPSLVPGPEIMRTQSSVAQTE